MSNRNPTNLKTITGQVADSSETKEFFSDVIPGADGEFELGGIFRRWKSFYALQASIENTLSVSGTLNVTDVFATNFDVSNNFTIANATVTGTITADTVNTQHLILADQLTLPIIDTTYLNVTGTVTLDRLYSTRLGDPTSIRDYESPVKFDGGMALGLLYCIMVKLESTEDSTDTLSGVIFTAGGVGIYKNLYIGAFLTISSSLSGTYPSNSITSAGGMGILGDVYIGGSMSSGSTNTFSIFTSGGMYVALDAFVGGKLRCRSLVMQYSSPATLIVYGGMGVGLDMNILNFLTTDTLTVSSTTDSAIGSPGSFNCLGGISVAKTTVVNGKIICDYIGFAGSETKFFGGVKILKKLSIGDNLTSVRKQFSNTVIESNYIVSSAGVLPIAAFVNGFIEISDPSVSMPSYATFNSTFVPPVTGNSYTLLTVIIIARTTVTISGLNSPNTGIVPNNTKYYMKIFIDHTNGYIRTGCFLANL